MKIETHRIPSHGLDLVFEYEADRFPTLKILMEDKAYDFISSLKINLNIMPMSDFTRVKGSLGVRVRLSCVRCLELFERPLNSRFTLNYSKEIPMELNRHIKEGVALTAQQIGMISYEGETIDFTEALQEQVVLALPYKPLCRDECKGLCHQCGQDLNEGECQCDSTNNSPFAVLNTLKLPSQ